MNNRDRLLLSTLFVALIFSFQNCGPGSGFTSKDLSSSSPVLQESTPNPNPTPTPNPAPAPHPSPMPQPSPAPSNSVMTDHVFTATSFWYTPIPTNASLHPNSANLVKEFLRQKANYYNNVNINTDSYSSPVYLAEAKTPTVRVNEWDCQGKGFSDSSLADQWAQVPIPSNALPSAGTDMEMTVFQPSTDTLWEFWQMRKNNGQWEACWGGRMQNASKNEGIFPGNYGTTATSLPFLGGQITAEELKRGEIRHAIGIALVDLEKFSIFSWPATRSDGYNPNNTPNRIAEGQRLRLDPNLNVDSLNIHPIGKIIAKAAQKYGFVVWDKAGSVSIRAQNAISYTSIGLSDPYHPTLFQGKEDYQVLDGIPWEKLQFLPMNYGQP